MGGNIWGYRQTSRSGCCVGTGERDLVRFMVAVVVAGSGFLACEDAASAHLLGPATAGNFSAMSSGPASDDVEDDTGFFPDTVTNTLTNNSGADVTMAWLQGANLGRVPYCTLMVAKNSSQTCTITANDAANTGTGSVMVTGGTAFTAQFHQYPLRNPAVGFAPPPGIPGITVGATLNDELASFVLASTLTNTGGGIFEYAYDVTTSSTSPVPFSWVSAGISGSVSSGTPFSETIFSDLPGQEVNDLAAFNLPGFDRETVAPAFVPAPAPPYATALGTVLTILLSVWRKSRG